MNKAQKLLLKDSLEAARDTVKTLEMLMPPNGSDSRALLSDTRSGSDDKATKNNGSELALPDQGWVTPLLAVRKKMLKEAEVHRNLAKIESNPVTFMERRRFHEGTSAGLVAYAAMLDEAVGVIRTQSGADGDELKAAVRHACHHLTKEAGRIEARACYEASKNRPKAANVCILKAERFRLTIKALECLLPEVSRKERSVSGNETSAAAGSERKDNE